MSDTTHNYLSTGCLHGRHDYCQSMTGYQGTKRPGTCKFCAARCLCVCHSNEMSEGNEMGVVKGTAKTAGTLAVVDVLVKVGAAIAAVLVAVKAIKALRGN